jgi:predicted DCC family thiol-disulfide oxidoreductase YuxK
LNPSQQNPDVPASIILFDGVCNLCNGWVNFVIERDPDMNFHFAALQSEAGQRILLEMGLPEDFLDSIVLVENGKYFLYSTSILRPMRRLNKLWPALYVFIVIPKGFRDWIYLWIASNRYWWFGKQDACGLPTPEVESRFLK